MNKFISRKFYLAVGGIALVAVLVATKCIDIPAFRDCFIACIVSYSAANVFAKGRDSNDTTENKEER
jgi:hypothetical protein